MQQTNALQKKEYVLTFVGMSIARMPLPAAPPKVNREASLQPISSQARVMGARTGYKSGKTKKQNMKTEKMADVSEPWPADLLELGPPWLYFFMCSSTCIRIMRIHNLTLAIIVTQSVFTC